MTMTEDHNAVFELKEQLNDVYRAYDALYELLGSLSTNANPPDVSPLVRLINERFAAILHTD
jgi:hypothetical protein